MRKSGEVVEANKVLEEKKIIAFYFSASWCPPCRDFTPILADFYSVSPSCR
jgi:nucleoredoxin